MDRLEKLEKSMEDMMLAMSIKDQKIDTQDREI